MSDTSFDESLRGRAKARRKQKKVNLREHRIEQDRLNRFRSAVEARGDAFRSLLWALDSDTPPTAQELEEHYKTAVARLVDALAALREANLLGKLEQLDDTATLAHYRQSGDDPQEIHIAYQYARQIIEADPDDHERLSQLVRGAVEETGLRRALHWVAILLNGMAGDQRLVWTDAERTAPPGPPSSPASKGNVTLKPPPTGQGEANGKNGKPAEPNTSNEDDPALSDRQYHILEALRQLGAISPEKRQPTTAIARRAEWASKYSATFKHAVAELGRRGLVGTKTGRGGGVWLTRKGLALIDRIISRRSPKR